MIWTGLALLGAFIWICILLLPWKPWSTRESLDSYSYNPDFDLSDLSVLIPARNEEAEIEKTLNSLKKQGRNLKVILVDDQSTDATAQIASRTLPESLQIVNGTELPESWAGKLWALEQGRKHLQTEYVLLMDADIELKPGILEVLLTKLKKEDLGFVSLMAALKMEKFWEKLLVPAYIYFFKLLFPFRLGNSSSKNFAAAAGGCILTRRAILEEIGGFAALKGALIDDCTLASLIKRSGYRTWTGLTHSVTSHRDYSNLKEVWNLVARFAFTYLRYSKVLLIICSLLLISCFWALPTSFLFKEHSTTRRLILGLGLASMYGVYIPTLRYYQLSLLWAFLKPLAGTLYLLMTWSSAFRYWRGQRSEWKGRVYNQNLKSTDQLKKAS